MELSQWVKSELGETIWKNKYQQNGESLDDWFNRVSGGDEDIKDLIINKKFLFGGRILASRGLQEERKVTYSNCYVLDPVEDSIEGIYDTAKHLARTFSYGGGCGIDISKLRPKGAEVHNAARTTTGPVSFMSTFSQVSETIGQSGRRGALMISMDCDHPDIEEFIDAKVDTSKLEGCNISVKMTNDFMRSLYNTDERLCDEDNVKLFNKLAYNNWNYAEPGILFWDEIRNYNLLSEYIKEGSFDYAGVNPCAEEPLPAGGSCLLGAINLSEFVVDPFTPKSAFNIPEFKKAVRIAVKGLNDVLDEGLDLHPLDIQKKCVKEWRQIGLGIMGFADMLIKLGIPYGSERSLIMIKSIGYAMNEAGLLESARLGKEKGSFDKFDPDKILNSTFMEHFTSSKVFNAIKEGLRNSQLFTIAPTGSISTMLGVSGGVEPLYDIKYTRTTKSLNDEETTYTIFTPIVEECIIAKQTETMPEEIVCSKTINPYDRVGVQGVWQKFIDASISSTVNLHEDVTPRTVGELYTFAWESGCKGLTIYRDNCARVGILNSDTPKKQPEPDEVPNSYCDDTHLDTDISNCIAKGTQLQTGCGSLWMTAYFHKSTGQLCHVFLDKGSQGGCLSNQNAVSRLISGWSKDGAPLEKIIDQLESVVACPSYAVARHSKDGISVGKSCPSAVGKALRRLHDEFLEDRCNCEQLDCETRQCTSTKDNIEKGLDNGTMYNVTCPECGGVLQMSGGCNTCPDCGWSKCE